MIVQVAGDTGRCPLDFRTTLSWTIIANQLMTCLQGSNHSNHNSNYAEWNTHEKTILLHRGSQRCKGKSVQQGRCRHKRQGLKETGKNGT